VNAWSRPTSQACFTLPVSFVATAIDVTPGSSRSPAPAAVTGICGVRPIRREKNGFGELANVYARSWPNWNALAPSTKKGRRSGKIVSNALRLTTAGSSSTWPKSGLIDVESVMVPDSS
jgi:hypothetical protein